MAAPPKGVPRLSESEGESEKDQRTIRKDQRNAQKSLNNIFAFAFAFARSGYTLTLEPSANCTLCHSTFSPDTKIRFFLANDKQLIKIANLPEYL